MSFERLQSRLLGTKPNRIALALDDSMRGIVTKHLAEIAMSDIAAGLLLAINIINSAGTSPDKPPAIMDVLPRIEELLLFLKYPEHFSGARRAKAEADLKLLKNVDIVR